MNDILGKYIREIINESKWEGITTSDVLEKLDEYKNNTWIFFDVESTGLTPKYKQLTEIAAIAVDIKDWQEEPKIIDTFNEKISLTGLTKWQIEKDKKYDQSEEERIDKGLERTPEQEEMANIRKKYGKTQDILKMTDYGGKEYEGKYSEESDTINRFLDWVDSFENPLFIIHNASFDMNFLSVRKNTPLKRYPVLDTLRIMQLHLLPLLKTLKDKDENAYNILQSLLATNKKGHEYYSVSQGYLSKAFNVSADNWHTAIADVKMLMSIFYNVVKFMKDWEHVDTRYEHGKILRKSAERRIKKKLKGQRRTNK